MDPAGGLLSLRSALICSPEQISSYVTVSHMIQVAETRKMNINDVLPTHWALCDWHSQMLMGLYEKQIRLDLPESLKKCVSFRKHFNPVYLNH